MEILIIILVVIGGFILFKIVIPAIQMVRENMKDIGEAANYVGTDHPTVRNTVFKTRFKHCVNKYKKKGYSEADAVRLAEQEFANNPNYLEP